MKPTEADKAEDNPRKNSREHSKPNTYSGQLRGHSEMDTFVSDNFLKAAILNEAELAAWQPCLSHALLAALGATFSSTILFIWTQSSKLPPGFRILFKNTPLFHDGDCLKQTLAAIRHEIRLQDLRAFREPPQRYSERRR